MFLSSRKLIKSCFFTKDIGNKLMSKQTVRDISRFSSFTLTSASYMQQHSTFRSSHSFLVLQKRIFHWHSERPFPYFRLFASGKQKWHKPFLYKWNRSCFFLFKNSGKVSYSALNFSLKLLVTTELPGPRIKALSLKNRIFFSLRNIMLPGKNRIKCLQCCLCCIKCGDNEQYSESKIPRKDAKQEQVIEEWASSTDRAHPPCALYRNLKMKNLNTIRWLTMT